MKYSSKTRKTTHGGLENNDNEYNKNNTYLISEDTEIINALNELGIDKSKMLLNECIKIINKNPICITQENSKDSLNDYFSRATNDESLIYVLDNDNNIVGGTLFKISVLNDKPIKVSVICSKIRKKNIGDNLLSILKQFSDKIRKNIELSSAIPPELKYYEGKGFEKIMDTTKYVYKYQSKSQVDNIEEGGGQNANRAEKIQKRKQDKTSENPFVVVKENNYFIHNKK